MTTPKLLSLEELSEAFLTVAGDASFASDCYRAEQALRSHIAALEAELANAAHAIESLRASLARESERALAYFRIAQRSAEITPDDVAWAEEQAAQLGLSATPPEEAE